MTSGTPRRRASGRAYTPSMPKCAWTSAWPQFRRAAAGRPPGCGRRPARRSGASRARPGIVAQAQRPARLPAARQSAGGRDRWGGSAAVAAPAGSRTARKPETGFAGRSTNVTHLACACDATRPIVGRSACTRRRYGPGSIMQVPPCDLPSVRHARCTAYAPAQSRGYFGLTIHRYLLGEISRPFAIVLGIAGGAVRRLQPERVSGRRGQPACCRRGRLPS